MTMTIDAASWRLLSTRERLGPLVLLFLKRTPPYALAGVTLGIMVGSAAGGVLGRARHRVGSAQAARTGGFTGGAVGLVFGVLAGLSEALLGILKIALDDSLLRQQVQQG